MSSQIEAAAVPVSQARANGEKTRGRFTDAQAVSDGLKARALSRRREARARDCGHRGGWLR
jgi:hypothetical protein